MDKHQIGVNAGKVWKLLNDNKRWSYCDLKRASELSDRDLNAAIGWLARENKIDFECSNGDDCLFLSVNVILAEYEKQIIMWGQNFHNYSVLFFNQLFLITLAGLPTATELSGMSLVTTLPAPIIQR